MTDVTVVVESKAEPEAWDELAARMGGGFYHCHAAALYNAARLNGEPVFAQALDCHGECVGLAAGTVSSSAVWPFSRYCKRAEVPTLPATASDAAAEEQAVLESLERALRNRGVFRVEIASYDSPHSATVLSALGYDLVPRSEFFIDLGKDLDTIWSEFQSKRRRCVRRAEERGVVTRCENTPEAVACAFRLHAASMSRRGIKRQGLDECIRLTCEHLLPSGVVDVFVTTLRDTPVCAKLAGRFGGRACGLVSGASDVGYECFGPIQQVWAQIRWYKEHGVKSLSLGGAKAGEEGLHEFKRLFGTTIVEAPAGTKVLSRAGGCLNVLKSALGRLRP